MARSRSHRIGQLLVDNRYEPDEQAQLRSLLALLSARGAAKKDGPGPRWEKAKDEPGSRLRRKGD